MVEWKVHRRIARSIIASPLVGVPFGLGFATWLLGRAVGNQGGFFVFLGACGMLFGAGAAATRWVLDGHRIRREADDEFRDESNRDHERFLDDLDSRLKSDGDGRTNSQLKILRGLHRRMRRAGIFDADLPEEILPDIKEKTELLYRSCLSSLERTLVLWNASAEMMTESARTRLSKSRESLIAEVGKTIEHLGATLDFLQTSKLEKSNDKGLARIRRELEVGLEVARRVEDRMLNLEQTIADTRSSERPDDLGIPP